MSRRCDYGKIIIKSPEMLQLVEATYRYRDELGLDDQPEIYEIAAQSAEHAQKVSDLLRQVNRAVNNLMVFFEVEMNAYDFLSSYKTDVRSSATIEDRIERMGSTYHKAINNWTISEKD